MRWPPILALLCLAACDDAPVEPQRRAELREERREKRLQAAEVKLAKTPVPRTYRYPDGELRVLQVLVPDGSGFVEQQQCFVWRDLEFKTSTISCPSRQVYISSGS